jgi:5-(carboxyamino)imidazole ribonucleotide synthase
MEAWDGLGRVPCILEAFVPFDAEVSQVAVRTRRAGGGANHAFWPLTQNEHRNGILWKSQAPAPCDQNGSLAAAARAHVARLMDELDYVGVIAVEFFVAGGLLVANEIAPRVHNSGHWTIDGAETSQFENHLRAVTGLPLGSTTARGASIMFNLVGKLPLSSRVLAQSGAHLHLYGKSARAGRKVGHVTLTGQDPVALQRAAAELALALPWDA